MAVVRLPQPYASNHVAMQNMEALQSVGEEVIYLSMFHVNIDGDTHPRCSECYDPDYNQQDKFKCPTCYGTTYEDGVKAACRAWSIVGDAQNMEDFSKQGVWNKERVTAQLEITPVTMSNDYIIRVVRWSDTHVPLELGDRYIIEDVGVRSVRTGARYGQVYRQDYFGQKTYMSKVDPNHPIQLYPISLIDPMPRLDEPLSYGIEMYPTRIIDPPPVDVIPFSVVDSGGGEFIITGTDIVVFEVSSSEFNISGSYVTTVDADSSLISDL